MRIDEIHDITMPHKAGVIPVYITETGERLMMFMVPSDPKFGGPKPQIAKGDIDAGEDPRTAALREGMEELGLIASNISSVRLLSANVIAGLDSRYRITVFEVVVKSMNHFIAPHFETGSTHWLTLDQFSKIGRKSHLPFVVQSATH